MSATRTRRQALLLDPRAGWHVALAEAVDVGEVLRLEQLPGGARPLVDAQGDFGGLSFPTGIAADDDGRVYLLDGSLEVRRFDPCTRQFETLPCIGGEGEEPRRFRDPHGLAIGPRCDLFVADTGNARVQVFALKGFVLRAIWEQPPGLAAPWEPWDVVVSPQNVAYVSDHANGVVHAFGREGWRRSIGALAAPTALALDREGRLYVVQDGEDAVTVLDADGEPLEQIASAPDAAQRFAPTDVAVDDDGRLLLAGPAGLVRCSRGTRTRIGGEPLQAPLAFDRDGNPIALDASGTRALRLDAQGGFETDGVVVVGPLDSLVYRCRWHRVALDVDLPQSTQIRIDTFTSEIERPAEEIAALPGERWETRQLLATVGADPWDCLVLSPPGRYLWVRATLRGDGVVTPSIRSLETEFPRDSSARFLPAVYREDPVGDDFLARFLSVFDSVREEVEQHVDRSPGYVDPSAAPDPAFLEWLASWLGLSLDRHWPEAKRRKLVQKAHRLFELRGTPRGLREHVELYTDFEPRLVEHFRLRRWLYLDHAALGEAAELYGEAIEARLQLGDNSTIGSFALVDTSDPVTDPFSHDAHRFTVFVPLREDATLERRTVERIIELAKPAHTEATLQLVTPHAFRLGSRAFVGVDTVVGRYPDELPEGVRRLGFDAVLGPSVDEARPPAMRIGVRARIGSTTLID